MQKTDRKFKDRTAQGRLSRPDIALLDNLVAWMQQGGVRKLTYSKNAVTVSLDLGDAVAVVAPRAPMTVVSPGMGAFTPQHPIASAPYVEEGTVVAAGDMLALLAIGPVLTAVRAPRDGTVRRVFAVEGAVVGFEDPLFELEVEA